MWKILFEYEDGGKITLAGKQKDIPLRLAEKYQNLYGIHSTKATYQQYPKKNHESMSLSKKIERLLEKSEE